MMRIAGQRRISPPLLLAGAATVALVRSSRNVSATCWESSRALNEETRALLERHGMIPDACTRASDIFDHVLRALRTRPVTPEMADLARRIETDTRLIFRRASVGLAAAPQFSCPAPLRVVVPYRATAQSPDRRENLIAVLRALNTQSLPRADYTIIVVEEATVTTIPTETLPLIDRIVTIADDGPFNKALAMNAGAAGAPADTLLCLLDGDILPDDGFLARNFSRLHDDPEVLHLPYTDMHCLLPEDSARLRGGERPGSAALDGWTITHPPGGCVFVSARLYRKAGGFDERFLGWGGEDREFVDRVQSLADVRRHPELLLHLDHERPDMRSDRDEIMSVLQSERG